MNVPTFARETLEDCWDEAMPLLAANEAETGLRNAGKFAPSREYFDTIERYGALRVYTMRLGGALIGYGAFLIHPHPFYPAIIMGTSVVLFVLPEHRGIRAVRFLSWIDDQLEAEKVEMIIRQVRPTADYSRTLERLGYVKLETSYVREMNHGT